MLPGTEFESSCGSPRMLEASESKEEACLTFNRFLEIKHVGLDFATVSFSLIFLSQFLFDMVFPFSIERKWLREHMEKFMMFNKRSRLSHSSRVKPPLVNMSASWFLVSTYLIWILGSKLILSDNQSDATLWVLDTCLIIGLRPLMIILITASLSSKMYNRAQH